VPAIPSNSSIHNNQVPKETRPPSLPLTQAWQGQRVSDIALLSEKLETLIKTTTEIKDQLSDLTAKQENFERSMEEKTRGDEKIKNHIDQLWKNDNESRKNIVQHNLRIERHENLFTKLLFPMFEDLFFLIASQNKDKSGNTLDADLKIKLERYLIQIKKTRESKQYSI
jgi:hypothetical protein